MINKKNFATTGTESFDIKGQNPDERVILNIQEDDKKGIYLDKNGLADEGGSNIFKRYYKKINDYFLGHSKVNAKDKAAFFHLLAVMINAGIPMIQSLKSLEAQLENSPRLRVVVSELSDSIEGGGSLSEAMLNYDRVFVEAEIGMVKSGEASGQLSRVLDNLAADTEKSNSIKSKVKSAMMYPIVIFVLLIVVVVAMMVFVIPKLTELFDAAQGELPLITKIVIATSDFMINHWLKVLVFVAGFAVFMMMFKKTDVGSYAMDQIKLKIPVFGKLFQKAYLARFARSLSNLLDSNVSFLRTLEITANSIGNEVYRKTLLLSLEDIKQGIPLAENLSSNPLFPPMMVNMIDVGEKTAQLDEITAKIASFYEDEVDTAVAGISKIIEPIMLIIIGGTVGIVVASIMLPIMKLADLSSNL